MRRVGSPTHAPQSRHVGDGSQQHDIRKPHRFYLCLIERMSHVDNHILVHLPQKNKQLPHKRRVDIPAWQAQHAGKARLRHDMQAGRMQRHGPGQQTPV